MEHLSEQAYENGLVASEIEGCDVMKYLAGIRMISARDTLSGKIRET